MGERQASPLSNERDKVLALSSQESLHSSGSITAVGQPRPSDGRDRHPPWEASGVTLTSTHPCLPSTSCALWLRELRVERAIKLG